VSALEILSAYGPLGVWVAFSVIRERWLLDKMEELSLRFDNERRHWNNERMRWISVLGRKLELSDDTITSITRE